MKRPMIAAAVVALILSFFVINFPFLSCLLIIPLCIGVWVCLKFKRFINYSAIFAVALLVLISSVYITTFKVKQIDNVPTEIPVRVSGQITSEYYSGGKAFFTLKTDNKNTEVPKNINISVYTTFAALSRGDSVVCDLYIDPIPKQSTAKYFSRGVYAFGTVSKVVSNERNLNLTAILTDFSNRVTAIFYKNLSNESAATLNAITIGDKYYLENDFEMMVKRSGVSHVMVVSGMHLAIICGTLLKFLRYLNLGNRLSAVITGIAVFLFMALCGFSMSILRAGITYFIMLFSLFIIRRADALNSLCVAVSLIIIANPFSAGSVGFLLSVFSTAGIILLNKPITESVMRIIKIKWKPVKLIVEAASVTLSALIFTFPLTVYYFGAVSTVSVITNLLIGFAVTLLLIFASLGVVFNLISSDTVFGRGLFVFCEYIARYVNKVITYFGEGIYAYIKVNVAVTIFCYLAIIFSFVIIMYGDKILKAVKSSANSNRTTVKG